MEFTISEKRVFSIMRKMLISQDPIFEKKPFVGEDDRFPWGPVTFYRYKNGSIRKIIFDEAFQGVKYWILDEDFKIVLDFFGKDVKI